MCFKKPLDGLARVDRLCFNCSCDVLGSVLVVSDFRLLIARRVCSVFVSE